MHPYTYKIRFLFVHPTLEFTPVKGELSKIPGIKTSHLSTRGQARYTHTGQRLGGTYRDSRWGFNFENKRSMVQERRRTTSGCNIRHNIEAITA
jgi:hypothetical protein